MIGNKNSGEEVHGRVNSSAVYQYVSDTLSSQVEYSICLLSPSILVERSDKETWLGMRREADLRVERRASGAEKNRPKATLPSGVERSDKK